MKKEFEWTCRHTWKRSAYNTLWCLIGSKIEIKNKLLILKPFETIWLSNK